MTNWFYDKQIQVIGQGEGYLDDSGIWHNGTETVVKTISCDIQPYTKELAYKDYGFTVDCTKRVFCEVDSTLQNGITVQYNGERYKIVKLIDWDNYYDIMLDNK
jgi:c-di-AMP phosphodiesterase-like protein